MNRNLGRSLNHQTWRAKEWHTLIERVRTFLLGTRQKKGVNFSFKQISAFESST